MEDNKNNMYDYELIINYDKYHEYLELMGDCDDYKKLNSFNEELSSHNEEFEVILTNEVDYDVLKDCNVLCIKNIGNNLYDIHNFNPSFFKYKYLIDLKSTADNLFFSEFFSDIPIELFIGNESMNDDELIDMYNNTPYDKDNYVRISKVIQYN